MPTTNVLDSTIYYEQAGDEATVLEATVLEATVLEATWTPLVFLHGNPSSSHLWRRVLPPVSVPGRRLLAPDLIGMGRSGKPDIAYRFADHARYLDAWFDTLGLDKVVLVGHDWGGALAFDWATRHPGRVRGIAFLETIVRPMTWDEFPPAGRSRFEAFRTPGVGERMVLDENVFLEQNLPMTVLTGLSEADRDVYRAPYPTAESRRPLLAWPRAMPLDGEPADVVSRIETYDAWLADSEGVPKLLLTFDGSSSLMIGEDMVKWCANNIANLRIEYCGAAGHLAPEDQPEKIAAAINTWVSQLGLPQ